MLQLLLPAAQAGERCHDAEGAEREAHCKLGRERGNDGQENGEGQHQEDATRS